MIQTWPTELPIPNRQNYNHGRADARLKTKNDAGPHRYRLMSSAVTDPVQLVMTLDRDQKEIFDRFYVKDTARGSLPFWMPDPTTDGWQINDENGVLLTDENDEPLLFSELWLCMFGDTTPSEVINGLRFDFSFSVGIMP
jgi:hypothetical protein